MGKLISGPELLAELFPNKESRPTTRWLRLMQARRAIPYVKLGRLVFFDSAAVREVIEKRFTIKGRGVL